MTAARACYNCGHNEIEHSPWREQRCGECGCGGFQPDPTATDQPYSQAIERARHTYTTEQLVATVARVVDLYRTEQYELHDVDAESLDELATAYDAYQRVRCPACAARMPTTESPLSPCPQHRGGGHTMTDHPDGEQP
jgi:hypothetical protein